MRYYVRKVENKRATTINRALRNFLEEIGDDNIISVTSDNGAEFSYTEVIEESFNIKWYKANLYCSRQRSQNKQPNRDLRVH